MSRPIAVLRPEPGNQATVARLRDAELSPLSLPLFDVEPLAWTPPSPADFDRLLLTSANAVRHAGPDLARYRSLPVIAVGNATAAAARAAGFIVDAIGDANLAQLLATMPPTIRLLWLSGEDRTASDHRAIRHMVAIYRAISRPVTREQAASLDGCIALVHSARAAARLAAVTAEHAVARSSIRIAAISDTAAMAAGSDWDQLAVAAAPNDAALIATARALAIDP